MTTVIRPAEAEEMAEFRRVVTLSLALDPGEVEAMQPEWTLCAFDDGQLATCYAAWPFTMRFNGAGIPVAAVTTVSTHPLMRRRGHLRAIMQADFERLHEQQGPAIAALYASLAAIYQRFGYGVVATHNVYRVEPRYLTFAHPSVTRGTLREVSPMDAGNLLNDLYKRFREPRNGYLHRSRFMWTERHLARPPAGHGLFVFVYEEDGEPLGAVCFTTGLGSYESVGPSQSLTVRDIMWLTPSAYQAIWERLQAFDLVREIHWNPVPSDDPLPHLLLEPRMLNLTSRDGILARIVDVERALPSRPYPCEGRLRFSIVDDMCSWNAGVWEMETSGAETSVRRSQATPDVSMPIHTLAMLAFGQISASEAARMGRLDAHNEAALDRWDVVMRTRYKAFCADHF